MAVGVDNDSDWGGEMLPWRWEAVVLVGTQLCILTQAELPEHPQQQFLFPGDKDRAPFPGLCPCTGRDAQEGTAAAWLQHGGSAVGPNVGLEWAKPEQTEWELHRE